MASTIKTTWLLRGIFLIAMIVFIIYLMYFQVASFQVQIFWPSNKTFTVPVYLLHFGNKSTSSNKTLTTLLSLRNGSAPYLYPGMCSSLWYKGLNLEFSAFGSDHFSKVTFLMDSYYTKIVRDRFYKCLFFTIGTNSTLISTMVTRIGGPNVFDKHKHELILQCPIPSNAVNSTTLSISLRLIAGVNPSNAVNVTICRSYTSSFNFINSRLHLESTSQVLSTSIRTTERSSRIAACTQTYHHDEQFPMWLEYHQTLGVAHFYLYDHAPFNETRLHKSLRTYIDSDLITIIPWHIDSWQGFQHRSTPSFWITHQIWSQNDCLRRFGHLHSWILLSDVDEFVVPAGGHRNFEQVLAVVPPNYCALQVLHYAFHGSESVGSKEPKDRPRNYVYRRRKHENRDANSKNFVRPQLVHYFAVHQVVTPVKRAPVLYADVQTHARLHHYRDDIISRTQLVNFTLDTHIWPFLDQMNNRTTNSSLFNISKS